MDPNQSILLSSFSPELLGTGKEEHLNIENAMNRFQGVSPKVPLGEEGFREIAHFYLLVNLYFNR